MAPGHMVELITSARGGPLLPFGFPVHVPPVGCLPHATQVAMVTTVDVGYDVAGPREGTVMSELTLVGLVRNGTMHAETARRFSLLR